jgi:hypothetical protein
MPDWNPTAIVKRGLIRGQSCSSRMPINLCPIVTPATNMNARLPLIWRGFLAIAALLRADWLTKISCGFPVVEPSKRPIGRIPPKSLIRETGISRKDDIQPDR